MIFENQNRMPGMISALVFGILSGLFFIFLDATFLLKILFTFLGIVIIAFAIPGLLLGCVRFSEKEGKAQFIVALATLLFGVALILNHSQVLMIIIGAFLLLLPILEVIFSQHKRFRLRAELPKILLGIILLVIGPGLALDRLFDIIGVSLIVVSVLGFACSLWNYKTSKRTVGSRIFVDTTGDGKIDTVYMDTTGDGKTDTATKFRDGK